MIRDTLQKDLNDSLKKGLSVRVETIRFLMAAITNFGITKYGPDADKKLTDADITEIVKKQVKTHKESIDAFAKAGRQELVDGEKAQLTVLEEYAPKEMGDEELRKLLLPVSASGEPNFGLLMKQAMALVAGKADGGRVAATLKQLMSSK